MPAHPTGLEMRKNLLLSRQTQSEAILRSTNIEPSGGLYNVDAIEIIAAIKRRRDSFFDSQIVGTSEDPLEYSAAGLSRAIADEYDSLLVEIQGPNG